MSAVSEVSDLYHESHHEREAVPKHYQQVRGTTADVPDTVPAPRQSRKGIVYTDQPRRYGSGAQAVRLSSWQSIALAIITFSSFVTMGLMVGVLAMAIRVGLSVKTVPWNGGNVHILRTSGPSEW
jgi:hypothetical protein